MKVRLQQINPIVGDIEGNFTLIKNSAVKAEKDGIDLLILPEMVLTGYPVQDLIEKEFFRDYCYKVNRKIVEATGNTAVLFGTVTANTGNTGRKMYNSALLARNGKLLGTVHKTLLPTYDVFDDLRYFEPNKEFKCLELDGVKLGVTICEDIWYNENEHQYHLYDVDPAAELKKRGAQVIINVSASPFTKSKHENRLKMLQNHAKRLKLPVLYSNQVGTHTEIIFDGDSLALDASGKMVTRTIPFEADYTDVTFHAESGKLESAGDQQKPAYPENRDERNFRAICLGILDYFDKTGLGRNVVLGLSGGIDSALVTALAVEALGKEHVTAVTMASEFSSKGSVNDSELLAENLGITLHQIPISKINNRFLNSLKPYFKEKPFGTAEENLQSRIRGNLLMAFANKFNSFLLATGNKSEYAVGYATLYGDMNGALAPIGDLYKTEVYSLARWMNRELYRKEVVPDAIIIKEPSAELRPDQKDSDSLPEYEILDDILERYIEHQQSAGKIVSEGGFDAKTVQKVIQMVDNSEFKRYQAVPILKLSAKAFGVGRRWPIVQKWTGHEF